MNLKIRHIVVHFVLVFSLCISLPLVATNSEPHKQNKSYDHSRFSPDTDIEREFAAFSVGFDSKDDDDGDGKPDIRRIPEWVAQHIKRTKEECLDTSVRPRKLITDKDLYSSGVAPNDDSYRNSGFDRGHMAAKLLAARVGKIAEWETHTVLNVVPQLPRFNQQIWRNLEDLTGAWAQIYGEIWVIQGPVFDSNSVRFTIGDSNERKVAVPDALFKIVIREKSDKEKDLSPDTEIKLPELLVFLYPQLGPRYYGSKDDFQHERFLTSLSEIEALTGLHFFAREGLNLNEKSLERIRSNRAKKLWPTDDKKFVTECTK